MGRRPQVNILEDCPVCGAIFGTDEMDQDICFCCGYPETIEENFGDDEMNDEDNCGPDANEIFDVEQF